MYLFKVIISLLSLVSFTTSNYEDNMKFIEEHNLKNTSYEVGINEFMPNTKILIKNLKFLRNKNKYDKDVLINLENFLNNKDGHLIILNPLTYMKNIFMKLFQ